jgi:hypothetical protein
LWAIFCPACHENREFQRWLAETAENKHRNLWPPVCGRTLGQAPDCIDCESGRSMAKRLIDGTETGSDANLNGDSAYFAKHPSVLRCPTLYLAQLSSNSNVFGKVS